MKSNESMCGFFYHRFYKVFFSIYLSIDFCACSRSFLEENREKSWFYFFIPTLEKMGKLLLNITVLLLPVSISWRLIPVGAFACGVNNSCH